MFSRKSIDATYRLCKYIQRKYLLSPLLECDQSKMNYSTQLAHNLHWSTAVSEAEKVVGPLTAFLKPGWEKNDEKSAVTAGKNLEPGHQLVTSIKDLLLHEQNYTEPWGLVVLLLSKTAGQINMKMTKEEMEAGVLHSQCVLAEITELIRTSILIHKCLINIHQETYAEEAELKKQTLNNKMALLCGDYILANVFRKIGSLRNQEITVLMDSAIGDMCQEEFVGRMDLQNTPLPSAEDVKDVKHYWTRRNTFSAASLLGKSCQGSMNLAGHSAELQEKACEFGKHLALAWQAFRDMEPFQPASSYTPGSTFDLSSAPVIFHLQHDSTMFEEIDKGVNSVENVNYEKVHQRVTNGPGLNLTKGLQKEHLQRVMEILSEFQESMAQRALKNIVAAMNNL